MAKKPLRSQLNQIRAWVQEGRTDAWIAHQLELPAAELAEFKRRHGLTAEGGETTDVDLRDEIEAEIEAATAEEAEAEDSEEADADEGEEADDGEGEAEGDESGEGAQRPRRRRRGRRGGRGRRKELEATFDHGETDGYGLWLDPSVKDNPVYAEHWAGQRQVTVRIDADQIVIRRPGSAGDSAGSEDSDD